LPVIQNIRKAWNAFLANDRQGYAYNSSVGSGASTPNHQNRVRFFNEQSIVGSIYTRIAIDVAGVKLRHVEIDAEGRYKGDMQSRLNECLTLIPNIDQTPRGFIQDLVMTTLSKGSAAVVPVDTILTDDPEVFEVEDVRVGEILEFHPRHVRVNVWNESTGKREDVLLEKRFTPIVDNPLYTVMNASNSTLQRLIRKLQLLDVIDEQSGSGKLDLIIQLPYVVKSKARQEQAEKRRDEIEFQLRGSKYGIAYTDGTEKITQLNRPAENNLLKQVEFLTEKLYGELGITEGVMNGTADEKTMLNYYNRTVEPILDAIVQAMQKTLLGRTGTDNLERIHYFRDPFKLVPLSEIAVIADKFSRNEIFTANEIRSFMGIKPSTDPKADKLVNSNMPEKIEEDQTDESSNS
jgi:hypothetical protein